MGRAGAAIAGTLALAVMATGAQTDAHAQSYPHRSIKIVVPATRVIQ